MVLVVLLPVINSLLDLDVVGVGEPFVDLFCGRFFLFLLPEHALELALWHASFLLLCQGAADIQRQLSEKNQLVVVVLLDRGRQRESRILGGIWLAWRQRLTLLDIGVPLAHVQAITSHGGLTVTEALLVLCARGLLEPLISLLELIYH